MISSDVHCIDILLYFSNLQCKRSLNLMTVAVLGGQKESP